MSQTTLNFKKSEVLKESEGLAAAKHKSKAPVKASTTRKRKADENDDPSPDLENASAPSKKKTKATSTNAEVTKPVDPFAVSLPGEDEGEVEIYDSCDELRRKITVHLSVSGTTKAAFLRDIIKAASYPIKIQSKQLADFLALRGATGGNSSKVCYASYVYFEKKRIAEGEKKSKHRLGMEETWGAEGGLPREMRRGGYWCGPGSKPVEDKYGKVKLVKG